MAEDQETVVSSSSTTVVDTSNPLYIHPSENAGTMLVPVPFDGIGYRSRRRGVLRALSVKNKIGFINGKVKKPDTNSTTLGQWERYDDMDLVDFEFTFEGIGK